ncbi:MAG: glycosyl transferase family 2 [Planctomycetota bacterium]|nr:MAG: glycosyl transferase family 2 [Planctomycetota bacterium]
MISFIIPAHNEEAWIARSVAAVHAAMASLGDDYELIVVDDACDDATAELAADHGAKVIRVNARHISAARNAGARAARGDFYIFVDADTLVSEAIVAAARDAMRQGAAGGGCVPRFDGRLPWWSHFIYPPFALAGRLLRLTGGACQFCRRDVFEAVGGFSESHFAAEDLVFARAIKRHGPYVVPRATVLTSGRNLRAHSPRALLPLLLRLVVRGPNAFLKREGLEIWYEPRREET